MSVLRHDAKSHAKCPTMRLIRASLAEVKIMSHKRYSYSLYDSLGTRDVVEICLRFYCEYEPMYITLYAKIMVTCSATYGLR